MLTFDEASHTYRWNGQVVPSVTQVLEGLGLIDKRWYKPEHAERGTYVHKATLLVEENDLDWETVPPDYLGFIRAYERFLRESGFRPSLREHRVYCARGRYAGTLDRTGILNGRPVLLDIKSGSLQAWAALQTAGYAAALQDMQDRTPYERFGLQLRQDGTYRLEPFADPCDLFTFLGGVNLFHWKAANA